jgi:TP901 family phage tail tape measure protein
MAENNEFEAKHIASLDFDVSKIKQQFADLGKETENAAKKLKMQWNGILKDNSGAGVLKLPEMSYQSVQAATKSLQEMLATQGQVTQFKYGFDELGETFKATATVIDGSGNKITETYNLVNKNVGEAVNGTQQYEKVWQSAGGTITQNFKKVGDAAENADKKTQSFFQKVIDKVYWTAAFRITNTLFQIPGQIYEVIKDTEYAVVEITRILNEATLDAKEYTKEIYNIAIAYGATFDDAVDITKKFAQAGYNSAESIGLMKQALVALNTAELDANQATTGMIAIMKQLGWSEEYALENLDLLIDKVNITADNFAIDSATLIEALQKVAGTAAASGQSLDDMIGIITVLSETTGASGANIGNAYKSIISYIQRAQSLTTFENLGIEVYADKLKGTLLPINQILDNLNAAWRKWDETAQTSFVGQNTELIDTLNELNDQTGEYQTRLESLNETVEIGATLEERNAAQAAAGMYRRNYFIALMNNYNDVQKVTNGLLNAEGYSMAENTKTMDTLEKKVTALKTSVQSLLYEYGQAGALEIAKSITDIFTGIAKITQNTGGLNNVLWATAGLVMLIKAQDISASIGNISKGIKTLGLDLKALLTGAKTASGGVSAAFSSIGVAILGVTAIISVASAIESAYQKKIADGIAQSKEYVNSVNATKDSIKELVEQYKELYNSTGGTFDDTQLNTIKGIQEQINDLLGAQAEKVDLVNAKLADQEQIYKKISYQTALAAQQGLSDAVNAASKSLEKSASLGWADKLGVSVTGSYNQEYKNLYSSILGKYFDVNTTKSSGETSISAKQEINNAADIYAVYQKLISAQKDLYNSFGENATAMSAQDTLYQALALRIGTLKDAAEAYAAIMQAQADSQSEIKYAKKLADGFDDSKKNVTELYRAIERGSGDWFNATEWERQAMMELLEETYPEYFGVVQKGYGDLVDTQITYNKLVAETKASLKDLTGAYQTLVGAVDEYNKNGTISLETLDSLLSLSPEYIMMLADENGQLELSADAYENKFRAMVAVLQAQKLDEITAWVKGLTAEQIAVEGLSEAYATLGQNMLEGKLAALQTALADKVAAGILTVEQATQLANAIKNYFAMFDNINMSTGGNANTTKDLVSEAERQIDWLQFYAEDSAEKHLEIYEDLLEKQTEMDEERLDTLRKIAKLKIQIAEDEADAAIAAKKKEWDEIDREEEYRNRRKELQDELAYWSVRGTAEAARKRSEITERIAELESDKQREDSRDAEIAALELARDAQIKTILQQYGQLEQDVMQNMLTEEERKQVSDGMDNLNNMNTLMGDILNTLTEIKTKPAPTINVTVENNNDGSSGGSSGNSKLGQDVADAVKKALEGYYTK